jgi:integrase
MASAMITIRTTKAGAKRYVVRFRLGGRAYPIEHGGSFKTMKEARARRDLIAGELAAGRNPALALAALTHEAEANTLATFADEYLRSRIDLADETTKNLGSHLKRIRSAFGESVPTEITWGEVQAWVAAMAAEVKPSSLRRYVTTLRQLLDFAGVDPNPARDRRVKLPAIVTEEPTPPSAKQFLTILENVPAKWVLPLIVMEQTAIRVGEAHSLAWGDVDVAGSQFRLRGGETKSRRARWVQVPEWLMEEIAATCPLEDRSAERRVFPGFSADVAKNVMARTCKAAGILHFHPHDLRHRRITIWHHEGIPARVLAERAGHARASMSLDVYSHVMPADEVPAERLRALIER